MPLKLNSSGGGSVTLDVPATATATNLVVPAANGTVVVADNSGNVTYSGATTFSGNATFNAGLIPSSSFLRNRIINGGMDVNQRNAGNTFNCPIGQVTYGIDRFYVYTEGAALTGQRVNPSLSGFPNALRVTSSGASTFIDIGQRIESANIADLAGSTVTISFWAASSSVTGITAYTAYANSQDNFNSNTNIGSTGVSITSTLTRYTVSFALPSQAANGLVVGFILGSGLSSGNTFTLTGVQLEVGAVATPFERRQFGQELALCQRYYYTIRATNSPLTNFGVAAGQADLFCLPIVQFPQIMRASPTFSSSAANTFNVLGATCTQVFADIMTPWTASWTVQASGVAPTGAYRVVANSTVNAFVAFSAEL